VENIAYFYTLEKQSYIKIKNNEDLLFDKCLEEIELEVDEQVFSVLTGSSYLLQCHCKSAGMV
jgi:hypothetical protein